MVLFYNSVYQFFIRVCLYLIWTFSGNVALGILKTAQKGFQICMIGGKSDFMGFNPVKSFVDTVI